MLGSASLGQDATVQFNLAAQACRLWKYIVLDPSSPAGARG